MADKTITRSESQRNLKDGNASWGGNFAAPLWENRTRTKKGISSDFKDRV